MDDDDSSRVSPLKKMLSAFPAAPGNLHQIAPTMQAQAKRVFQTAGRRRGASSRKPFHDQTALMKKNAVSVPRGPREPPPDRADDENTGKTRVSNGRAAAGSELKRPVSRQNGANEKLVLPRSFWRWPGANSKARNFPPTIKTKTLS